MKSKIKIINYLLPTLIIMFLLFVLTEMSVDCIIQLYSLVWFISLSVIILFVIMFWYSFRKIPKIKIVDNEIHYIGIGLHTKFKIQDITSMIRVDSNINSWYSFRGGLEIHTSSNKYIFPYNVYSNEATLLQYIYQISDTVEKINCSYKIGHIKFIKYLHRNFYSFLMIPVILFVMVVINKQNNTLLGISFIALLVFLILIVVILTSRYIKIESQYLVSFNPFLMQVCKYNLNNIIHTNNRHIRTGRGGLKSFTIELVDKRIITLNAGLNKQKEIDELADVINSM